MLLFLLFRSWDVSCHEAGFAVVVSAVSVVTVVAVVVEVGLVFVSGSVLVTMLDAAVGLVAAGTVVAVGNSLDLVEVMVEEEALTLAVS